MLFPCSGPSVWTSDYLNTPYRTADFAFCSNFCFNKLNSAVECSYLFSLQDFVIIFSVRECKQVRSVAIAQLALSDVLNFVLHVFKN